MPAGPTNSRPQLERTSTWPPTTRVDPELGNMSTTMSTTMDSKPTYDTLEDLDEHPGDHFLSPMQYEDWASDSDDDGEEIEWTAGITDFALFDSDRRQAQETGKESDPRWDDFLSTQRSVLQRSVERRQLASTVDTTRPPLPVEDVPGLTPDSSPNLRDDLEADSHDERPSADKPIIPSYLTVTIAPPSPEDRMIDDDEDLPLSFSLNRGKQPVQTPRKVQRPGLRHARTMSGKAHVWRRPSWQIYPVGEDPDAERRAEQGMIRRMNGEDDLRGRRSGRDA